MVLVIWGFACLRIRKCIQKGFSCTLQMFDHGRFRRCRAKALVAGVN